MSVNSYLSGLASNLVLSNTEKSNISTSVDTIKTRLSGIFQMKYVDEKDFWSYVRGTILPRKLMKSLTWIL